MDPKVFPEPETLKPERFLDPEGQLCRNEQWVPFSMGKSTKDTMTLYCFNPRGGFLESWGMPIS